MLNQTNINWRQAEFAPPPPAVPQFESPQDELKWLKQNRRNLKGFVRVLEVIEAGNFFTFDHWDGTLDSDWLDRRGWLIRRYPRNDGCIGTLLHWFFADEPLKFCRYQFWEFQQGRAGLAAHLGMRAHKVEMLLHDIVRRLAGHPCGHFGSPFASRWPVSYSAAFRELAAQHPAK